METLLVEAGIIMLFKVAHFHLNIKIIYSVMYISPFTNDIIYIKHLFAVCSLKTATYISQHILG